MSQKFPIFYIGSAHLFTSLPDLKLKQTLLLPHPCIIHQPLQFLPITKKQYLQPLLTLVILDESQVDLIKKGSLQTSQPGNTIYIYYPYELQVDQFVYKQVNTTYENILKEIPRGMRDHFCKYVEWKDGKGDHSIQYHANKLTTLIEKETKNQIEKRVAGLLNDIALNEQEPVTYNKMYRQWASRTKLCMLYSHLNLFTLVEPLLQTQYNLIKSTLKDPQFAYPPCNIKTSFNPINQQPNLFFIKLQRKQLDKLQIITQIYLLTFSHLIQTLKLSEGLNLMKYLLIFVREEVFDRNGGIEVEILNKLWEIQVVEMTLGELIKERGLTITGKAELEGQIVEYKVYVRKIVQWVGRILLGFNPVVYSLGGKEEEVRYLLGELRGEEGEEERRKGEPQGNKGLMESLSPQLGTILSLDLRRGLKSFEEFILMQANTIYKTIMFLKQTKFRRVELQLQIQFFILSISYLTIHNNPQHKTDTKGIPKQLIFDILKHQKIPTEFPTWLNLSLIYKIYLCRTLLKIKQTPLLCQKLLQLCDISLIKPDQRSDILSYVNNNIQKELKYKKQIGEVVFAKVIKNKGNRSTILIRVRLDWDIEINRMCVKFMDSKKKEYLYQRGQKEGFVRGENEKEIELVVDEGNYLFLKGLSLYFNNIHFQLSIYTIKDTKIFLETVEIKTIWEFEQQICYNNISTPIKYQIKGVEETEKLFFQWSSELELSKVGFINGREIQIQNLTQIELKGKEENVLEIFVAPCSKKSCIYAVSDIKIGNFVMKDDYAIKFRTPIRTEVKIQNQFVQYKIINISNFKIHIKGKQKQYELESQEELNLLDKTALIGLTPRCLVSVSLDSFCEEKMEINMGQQKFGIRLESEDLRVFNVIRFRSEMAGNIRILAREGYEVVGKIKGQVGYRCKEGQVLDVGIIPTRVGKIVLPDVEIDGKKGEWKHPLILEVK